MNVVEELPNDRDIQRDRVGRMFVLFGTIILFPVLGAIIGFTLTTLFTTGLVDNGMLTTLGTVIGAGVGLVGFLSVKHRFSVINSTTGILLTTNTVKAFFGSKDIFVEYGPGGPHISYPWEMRAAENNISVKTATNDFEFEVQCSDGTVTVKGSYRLRPDHRNPRRFQTGVAAVADDLKDLIGTFLVETIAPKSVKQVLKDMASLQAKLEAKFVRDPNSPKKPTEFEGEHGVLVIDVTVSSIMPSKEVQRTMSSITEARVVSEGTRLLLGFNTQKALDAALASNAVTRQDYNHARDRFMAISGNMEGVNVSRFEIDLNASGIDKDTAESLVALLRNTPPTVLSGIAAQVQKGAKK